MFDSHQKTNKWLALATFFISLVIYTLTMAPTASFWDAGEFIAVAHGLQVNHPPGAPFYSILGRLFSMFMPTEYVAISINFMSVLSSALTVMLLYLIVVRLIREFKPNVNEWTSGDKIAHYGGALIGSLTFAVTDTFWFNAVEAEVYAMSMFFTAIVVWLALKWSEHHEKPYSERWLVLIAYMFGLAIGVHLLNLLAIFFVALIVYFKVKDTIEIKSFGVMGIIAVFSFFLIYPITIQKLPDWASKINDASYGLIGPFTFIFLLIGLLVYGIYYTQKHKHRLANIALISYVMIIIGYSSYSVIMIRSIADPPVDENDPETVEDFVSYLKREQYGDTPILKGNSYDAATGQINTQKEVWLPRRHSQAPNHLSYYARYDSDFEYFWDYQVRHMYLRYFNWNFVGRVADIQDTGWQSGFEEEKYPENRASNAYYFIPLLLGLIGVLYHFKADRNRALAVLVLFIVTGLAIIVFLNQPPYQPRERDYAYVGSFFAFAIWIGLGSAGLLEFIHNKLKNNTVSVTALVLLLLASPVWMASQNWDDHDRSNRYVAPDYAKNLLNSLAPNAIVFTNGDNDTFPLWYAQEVEGVRTDVRIVCLSLLNTDWYIKQLKNQWSHESAPLPFSYTDQQIDQITSRIDRWEPKTITIPVNKEALRVAFSEDQKYKEAIGVRADTSLQILKTGVDFEIPVEELDDELRWRVEGRLYGRDQQGNGIYYMQVQDLMIIDLLQSNNWLRPIYFANTVSSSSMLDLQPYFRTEGKAYRVIPKRFNSRTMGYIDPAIHAKRLRNFSFTEWNNPDAYFDENIRRMLSNYRYTFLQLSERYQELNEPDSARYWLDFSEQNIPFRPDEESYNIQSLFAINYLKLNAQDQAAAIAKRIRPIINREFINDFEVFQRYQQEFDELNNEFEASRRSGDVKKQRDLRASVQAAYNETQRLGEQIIQIRQYLVIAQYVLYESGNENEAFELSQEVNSLLLGTPFPSLPLSKEESDQEVRRYGIL